LLSRLPRHLSVVTDVVGYPTHADFNYELYFWRYYVGVLVAPSLAALLDHLIGLRWPGSRWPDAKPEVAQDEEANPRPGALAVSQALRALAVGATLGAGCALFFGDTRFWPTVGVVAILYAAVLLGAAAVYARHAPVERFAELASTFNSLAIPLTLWSLYAASCATRVTVAADGSMHPYPWLPGWLTALIATLAFAAILAGWRRARDLPGHRRVETHGLVLVVLPIVLYLYTAALPDALGAFDTFHFGEFVGAARLFDQGAFPWRDSINIHGLLQDVLNPLAGFKLFGDTAWAAWAGFAMLGAPFWWVTLFLLLAYLLRGNVALLLALVTVPLLRTYDAAHWRFALLPPILLALAALLERATWLRAVLLASALLISNILVPELAYAVPACGLALLGFELTRYDRGRPFLANLPRTIRATVAGVALSAVWAAYLVYHHAARPFLLYYAAFARSHALTGAMPHLRGADFFFFMFLPPLLLLLAFWYCAAAVRMRRVLDVRDWVMVAAAIVTLLYYQKFLSRADWHVLQSVSPALPLSCYAIYKLLPMCGLRSRRALAASAAVLVAVFAWFAPAGIAANLTRVPSNFARVVPAQPVFAALGWSQPGVAAQAAGWTEVQRFLDSTIDPEDTFFDFSNEPGLYHYLLRRKPATRYYHVSMAIRRPIQLDLIEELDRARPKLIAFDSDSGLPQWDAVPNEVRHYDVSSYILHRYRPFARVAGRIFYLRNDLPLDRRPPAGTVEPLRAPAAYLSARACDWGYAPGFLGTSWLEPAARLVQRQAMVANRLELAGWAVDAGRSRPAREVLVMANGRLLARAALDMQRPDIVAALGSPDLQQSGFSFSRNWVDTARIEPGDVGIYGVSQDGRASRLQSPWAPRTGGPSELRVNGEAPIQVLPGAVRGILDAADLYREVTAAFDLPEDTPLSAVSGLEIDAEVSQNARIEISDRPFAAKKAPDAGDELPAALISFRVRAPASRAYRLIADNCPQWYALSGRTLYLRYRDAVAVRGVRLLVRSDGRDRGEDTRRDPAAANAFPPR
jgi:hypothetical protein